MSARKDGIYRSIAWLLICIQLVAPGLVAAAPAFNSPDVSASSSSLTVTRTPIRASDLPTMGLKDNAQPAPKVVSPAVVDNSPADGATNNKMLLQAFNSDGGPVNGAAISWIINVWGIP